MRRAAAWIVLLVAGCPISVERPAHLDQRDANRVAPDSSDAGLVAMDGAAVDSGRASADVGGEDLGIDGRNDLGPGRLDASRDADVDPDAGPDGGLDTGGGHDAGLGLGAPCEADGGLPCRAGQCTCAWC